MAATSSNCSRKEVNRGTWTTEEDHKLAQVIEIHGPKRWKYIAGKAGLNRCGKSCRLRWMNYLRPNIKRGNISDQEEDLILRLHKLLGNRWSLIAGRLPGRTDNEIKNYWNSRLRKKIKQNGDQKQNSSATAQESMLENSKVTEIETRSKRSEEGSLKRVNDSNSGFTANAFIDLYKEQPLDFEWMDNFFEMGENWFNMSPNI